MNRIIEAIWAPDKQAKMVLIKNCVLEDIHEISDSVQCQPAQSWTPPRLKLRGVGNFQGIKDPYDDILKKFEYFLKIQNWLTLRGVGLCVD